MIDSNANDTILHALIDPAYTGPVQVKVLVEDGRGYMDSLYYDFDYFGTTYEPLLLDSASVCSTQPVVLQVENSGPGLSYIWSNGDTTASSTAYDPGWVWVTVDLGDCQFTDSIYLLNASLYVPILTDTAYCDSLLIDFSDPNLTDLYWTSLDTHTTIIQLDSTAIYPVSYTHLTLPTTPYV